jgi:TolB protein
MLVAGIAIALLVKLSRRPALARFTQTKLVRFTTDGKVVCAAISPDGKHVAYALTDNGQQSLWIRQVATSNTGVQIIAPLNWSYIGLTFSPDNDYIYFTAQEINSPSPLYRVPALGGKPIRLIDDVDTPPTFSPDGKRIAYERGYPDVDETSLMIANADGSGETKLVSLKGPRTQLRLGAGPSWSPDGETIVCSVSVADDSGTHQELYQVAVRGGDVRALTNGKWLLVARVAWVGDGQGLMMTAADAGTGISQVWYVSFPSGTPRRITNDLSEYRGLTLTADARLLAVVQSDQQSNVWVSPNLNGAGASPITSTNYDGFDGLSWTADGRLLYSAARNGFQDIWLTDSQGRHKTQLTENAGQNTAPVMSPDGHTIVFVSTRDGEQRLWRMDPDGSHPQRLTDGLKDMRPVFSADGQWVIYFSQSEQNILKISINGGVAASFLSEALPGSAAISPDGKMIALDYRKPALGKVKLAVAPLDNSGPVKLIDSHDVPHRSLLQWTSDGQAIAYIKTGGSASNVWLQPLAGGPSRQLTFFDSELIFNFAIARDGRLALTRGHEVNDLVLISSSD